MSRFIDNISITSQNEVMERIRRLEERLEILTRSLPQQYMRGRLRSDYTSAPASSATVDQVDKMYDMILLDDFMYVIIDNNGTAEWRKITMSSF